ncbi:MAG: UPF0280 family protein [Thermodesulfobacteriota bacterium]
MIQILSDGGVFLDYGPMRLIIRVLEKGIPLVPLAQEGAQLAVKLLEDLADCLPILKKRSLELKGAENFPEVVRRMIEATQKMEEADLTPMAAVAGTVSDVVADYIFDRGGTKILVDNGGDIAIRLREEEVARIGVKTEIGAERSTYLLSLDATMRIGGVATSGFGGRSFTKGIAQAAMAIAEKASYADAAATLIGNYTDVEDPAIVRILAEKVYPDTDIAGQWVTLKVGNLAEGKVRKALENGLSKAHSIFQKGLIKGALIALQGIAMWTDSLSPILKRL